MFHVKPGAEAAAVSDLAPATPAKGRSRPVAVTTIWLFAGHSWSASDPRHRRRVSRETASQGWLGPDPDVVTFHVKQRGKGC